jgi:hypothetical protein
MDFEGDGRRPLPECVRWLTDFCFHGQKKTPLDARGFLVGELLGLD